MFLKASLNPIHLVMSNQFYNILNADNISRFSSRKTQKLDKTVRDKIGWSNHKRKVLWSWVNVQFSISESFIKKLEKNIKRLNIIPTPREQEFLFIIKGLFFATWRPLKEMIVRFPLDKKETIYFFESGGNIYEVAKNPNGKNENIHLVSGDFYFSNAKIYVCDEDQKIKETFNLDEIENVEFNNFGTLIKFKGLDLLIRSENKYMSYVVLQRLMPKLKLNINKIPNLYNYFDFWNKLFLKIN